MDFFFFFSLHSDLGGFRATSQKPVGCFTVYANALPELRWLFFSYLEVALTDFIVGGKVTHTFILLKFSRDFQAADA